MSSIWKGMKKNFKGQIKLRRQLDEQNTHLEHIEETLRRFYSADPSTLADRVNGDDDIISSPYLLHLHDYH